MFTPSNPSRSVSKRSQSAGSVLKSRRRLRRQLKCECLESRRVLATFAVNTTLDTVAVDLLTGQDAEGNVSIRSAIMAANSQGGSHVIDLPVSELPYILSIGGQGENFAATGDLDVRSTIEITAASDTILDAQNVDRIFDVQGNGNLTLNGLHLTGGLAVQGGAIYNRGTLSINGSTVEGTAGELILAAAIVAVQTPVNAYGGAIFNAATGQLSILNSEVRGTARGSSSFGAPDAPGARGGHAYGGGLYNLGLVNIFGTTIFGDASAGNGADGSSGADGQDSIDGLPATNGQPGFAGGTGGYAYGGVIYNGATGEVVMTQTILDGNAYGGSGGRGGDGGRGGAASVIGANVAGQAGVGGNGGLGGLAYGGGIYNAGGTISFASGDFGVSRVRANAFGGFGGAGGTGGTGGDGDVDPLTESLVSGSNGAAGGLGANGGVAYGGGIYNLSGTVFVNQTHISGLVAERDLGAYGGGGGFGGGGGSGGGVYASIGNGNGGAGARGGRGGTAEGGGLYIKAGTVNMQNARVETYDAFGGDAGGSGPGGFATTGTRGSTTTGATGAAGQGGGASLRGGQLNIDDSTFYLNEAFGGQGGESADGLAAGMGGLAQGGAIFVGGGVMNMTTTLVERNAAQGGFGGFADTNHFEPIGTDGGIGGNGYGGGLAAVSGLVVVNTSTFTDNAAIGGDGSEGGTGNVGFVPIEGQIGGDGGRGGAAAGGGLYTTGGSFFISNTTIHGNSATGGLGGAGGPAQFLEAQVGPFGLSGGNSNGRGGGSFHTGSGLLSLDSVTVARNQIGDTLGSGAGLYNVGGTVQVHNTLIALNTLAAGNLSNNWDAVGTFSSQGYNIISVRNGTTGFTGPGDRRGLSTAPLDVQLGPLGDNGGFTPTAALLSTSIAINAGDPLNSLATDQTGNVRSGRADIGAFEFATIQEN